MRTLHTLLLVLGASVVATPARAQAYRVIINAENATSSLTKDQLQRVYLKKMTTWTSGAPIVPVDQSPRAAVRADFSTTVLGRDVPTMKNHWQQSLFAGRGVPPVEHASDAQVAAFVASNPNAIGYVSAAARLPDGVKIVEIAR
jgi:ABC-type phosphate transport system substrate-binding protein